MTVTLSKIQAEVLYEEAYRHRWLTAGGSKLSLICGCGERIDGVSHIYPWPVCPQALKLLDAFNLEMKVD